MVEFVDKNTQAGIAGTPLNRINMMAIQGFEATTIEFLPDGSIVETNSSGQTLTTVFNADGSITQTFDGDYTITKVTTFNNDGSITEDVI